MYALSTTINMLSLFLCYVVILEVKCPIVECLCYGLV
uniref:Uncharacterized protein n=1 Tax=Rhizophora mucronata TaxID=61149 RepID=A0A2P2Q8G5_RHIMU